MNRKIEYIDANDFLKKTKNKKIRHYTWSATSFIEVVDLNETKTGFYCYHTKYGWYSITNEWEYYEDQRFKYRRDK